MTDYATGYVVGPTYRAAAQFARTWTERRLTPVAPHKITGRVFDAPVYIMPGTLTTKDGRNSAEAVRRSVAAFGGTLVYVTDN